MFCKTAQCTVFSDPFLLHLLLISFNLYFSTLLTVNASVQNKCTCTSLSLQSCLYIVLPVIKLLQTAPTQLSDNSTWTNSLQTV